MAGETAAVAGPLAPDGMEVDSQVGEAEALAGASEDSPEEAGDSAAEEAAGPGKRFIDLI